MPGFDELILEQVFNTTQDDKPFKEGLEAFRELLKKERVVRLFVDGTPGMGHQASSIGVLRALTEPSDEIHKGLAYEGTVEIYYQQFQGGQATEEKIQDLLPEVEWKQGQGQLLQGKLHKATLKLAKYPVPNLQQELTFGFTGGADSTISPSDKAKQNFRAGLRVRCLLRLQPYRWDWPNQIQRPAHKGVTHTQARDLMKVQWLGGESFRERAYYMPKPQMTAAEWLKYVRSKEPDLKRKATILQWLTQEAQLEQYDLCVIYGFRYPAHCEAAPLPYGAADALLNLLCGILVSQRNRRGQPRPKAKPVIVVNLDELEFGDQGYPSFAYFESVLKGGPNNCEVVLGLPGQLQQLRDRGRPLPEHLRDYAYRIDRRKNYFQKIGAVKNEKFNRLQFRRVHQDGNWDLDRLKNLCKNWLAKEPDRVLFLQVGKVPPQMFNYVFSRSTLPTVFEGQNTANLALNLGRGYFHVSRPDQKAVNNYPSTLLGMITETPARLFQNGANRINEPLNEWPEREQDYFPEKLGDFIRAYMKQRQEGQGELINYLQRVKKFYARSRNDKLRMGINYLGFVATGRVLLARRLELGDGGPLQGLFTQIEEEIKQTGRVALAPGLFDKLDQVGEYYGALLGELDTRLVLDDAQLSEERDDQGEITRVQVQGNTDALRSPMAAVFEFTAEADKIESSGTFTLADGAWSPEGLPWIRLGEPFIRLDVAEGGLPVVGAIGGHLGDPPFKLSLALPIADGQWLFTGEFADPAPGLSTLYGLFGGVNLLSSLPEPIATLGGLQLRSIEAHYDSELTRLEYISATVKASGPLLLVLGISLTDLSLTFTVTSPGDTNARELLTAVSGNFHIGEGDDAPVVNVSAGAPELVFRGALVSGVIRIADLIGIFWKDLPPEALDALPAIPDITALSFAYGWQDGSWRIGCELGFDIEIRVSETADPTFTIDQVGLTASNTGGLLNGALTILPDDPQVALTLILTAEYGEEQGWRFEGRQSGGRLPLGALVRKYLKMDIEEDLPLAGLALSIETKSGAWCFQAETAEPWHIEPLGLDFAARVELGYSGSPLAPGARTYLLPARTAPDVAGPTRPVQVLVADGGTYSGNLEAEVTWRAIDLLLSYEFKQESKAFHIRWQDVHAQIEKLEEQWVARLELKGFTLGGLVEQFIAWATGARFGLAAPWSVLNEINLDRLDLEFNFTTQAVKLEYALDLPLDLVFAKIDKIILNYAPDPETNKDRAVLVTLKGRFPWNQANSDELGWDATEPEKTPAPPGGGGKYLDLRLLAMGQHVSIQGLEEIDSVEAMIARLRDLAVPSGDEIPVGEPGQPYFNPDSAWLIAADFGVLRIDKEKDGERLILEDGSEFIPRSVEEAGPPRYMVQLSVIFNDPSLYAVRLALDGDAVKIFKGLVFEILYRKVTDTVGVYQTELTLPEAMRELTVGAYSVTLPVFAIEVYTNGDFQVDLGFPWNQVFERSFTLQGIVPPGIPVLGSGGFYFGKLSGATSNRLPESNPELGQFNPVLVFGFGLQVGVGKYLEKGALRAGFSITVFGILEGVIAKWNPTRPQVGSDNPPDQLQGEYYFWLQGTVGIIGKLFGSVDLAIIKADVHVELEVYAQITVECYADIPISVVASVDIAITLLINLGLFKIKIHMSFSARIKETFVIANPESQKTPPWQLPDRLAADSLTARQCRRLSYARRVAMAAARPQPVELDWDHYQPAATPVELTGYFVPTLSAAGPQACYVALLFMDTVALPKAAIAPKGAGDTSFELLCKQILRWVIAAAQGEPHDAGWVDGYAVPKTLLEGIMLSLSDPKRPFPIGAEAAGRFMAGQFRLTVSAPTGEGAADTTVVAMPPELTLDVPAYNGSQARRYRFVDFNELDEGYIGDLRQYFDALAVQVEHEMDEAERRALRAGVRMEPGGLSMGSFCFGDYFLLLARQMVQGALDGLRNFMYPIQAGQTVQDIVGWVNEHLSSASPGGIAGEPPEPFTAEVLFEANARHWLTAGKKLAIDGLIYQVANTDTLESIAGQYPFGLEELAGENQDKPGILTPQALITYPDKPDYEIGARDTLAGVAEQFGVELKDLIDNSNIATAPGVLVSLSLLGLPTLFHTTADDNADTLEKVAGRYGVTLNALAENPHNVEQVTDLFATTHDQDGDEDLLYLNISHLDQFRVGELIAEIQRTRGLEHLSGMASRYFLHGMRLPTQGVKPKQPWMDDQGGECGLYALTGQQFPIPKLIEDQNFTFSLSNESGPGWVVFSGGPSDNALQVVIQRNDAARVKAVQTAAAKGILPKLIALGQGLSFEAQPVSYPLHSTIVWQSAGDVQLPYGDESADRQRLRIWPLPESVLRLTETDRDSTGNRRPPPRFSVRIGTYNEATSVMDRQASESYGPGTLIDVSIKRIEAEDESPTTRYTYELMGASERGIILLERLLEAMEDGDKIIHDLTLLYPPSPIGDTSEGLQSAGGGAVDMFISQVNLTTYTRPPELALAAGDGRRHRNFVQLLWQNSITRSGGYYLYYYDGNAKQGLPERIFNDKGEATVWVLAGYARPADPIHQNCMTRFMNCLVTGDAIDTSRSVVFVEACPVPGQQHTPREGDTLASIGFAHYMTAIEVAEQSPAHRLIEGAPLNVMGGTYLVSPLGRAPGGRLADLAAYFGTREQVIKEANPERTSWPEELPAYTAIRLPGIDTTVGKAVPLNGNDHVNGRTLGELAVYYGCSVADLAYANRSTPGLLDTSAALKLRGGPHLRTASVPAGTVPIGAEREVPAEAPDDPNAQNFGDLYLQHTFTMLGYRVWKNLGFEQSNLGLPMSPREKRDAAQGDKKIRPALAAKQAGEYWEYRTVVPYSRYTSRPAFAVAAERPDPTRSPYAGVGELLQVDFGWQDIFGNRAKTPLSDPSLEPASAPSRPPVLLGYTDALVGLGAWPGIASTYYVPRDERQLAVVLALDPSRYDPAKHKGPALPCILNDDDEPAWQAHARIDRLVYTRLYYQLLQAAGGDSGGVTLSLETSLLAGDRVPFNPEQSDQLLGWVGKVWQFLKARESGDTEWPAPDPLEIAFPIADASALNPAQVFELKVALRMARPVGTVQGALREAGGVVEVSTPISPMLTDMDDTPSYRASANQAYTLKRFAADFEQTLSEPGRQLLKIATGVDRHRFGRLDAAKPLWVVRVGIKQGEAISYRICNPNRPKLFSPRPISNHAESWRKVPIWDYTSGEVIDFNTEPSRHLDFVGVDMDGWARTFVEAVDYVLSPQFVSPAGLLGQTEGKDYLNELLELKRSLAESISKMIIPVFRDEEVSDGERQAAQEAFRQQLLIRLANAYSTSAVIQFQAEVAADINGKESTQLPRLYGTPLPKQGEDERAGDVALTSAKLTLKQTTEKDPALLTFLMQTRDTRSEDPSRPMRSYVPLDLWFQGTHIEHEIGSLPGIEGYEASSWLSFVIPPRRDGDGNAPLRGDLGTFNVPLPLRVLPTPPSLVTQSGLASGTSRCDDGQTRPGSASSLDELLLWDYVLDYGEDYHQPQDDTHFEVQFNIEDPGDLLAEGVDPLFAALAEFVTVYPDVEKDLKDILRGIDANSEPEQRERAAAGLVSFIQLVQGVAQAWQSENVLQGRPGRFAVTGQGEPYAFKITESSIDKQNPDGEPALLVQLQGPPPAGIGDPLVGIEGYETEPVEFQDGYGFIFKSKDEETYLTAATGRTIPNRQVILPGMNILARQDAWASARLIRNKSLLPDEDGRETAAAFVYETPLVRFANACHPTLDVDRPVDIAQIGSADDTPETRTLVDHLAALFGKLFEKTTAPSCMLQLECRYGYALNAGLPSVSLPVFLRPPQVFDIEKEAKPPDGCPGGYSASAPAVSNLASAIQEWFQEKQPSTMQGTLHFDLTIMSNLTVKPMPLVRLRNLYLEIRYVKSR